MATIKLNIYKAENKNEIEKTYTAEGYDLMLGTVEDIMNVIDVDKMNDNRAVALMVMQGYRQIKPLLQDVFAGVTSEELDRVKIKEVVVVFIQICSAVLDSLKILQTGKN